MTRTVVMAAFVAAALVACEPRPTATPISPASAAAADLCVYAERVLAERGALGDALELVIRGETPPAAEAAGLIRERLAALREELRVALVAPSAEEARVAIRNQAELLDGEAAVIAKRGNSAFDRDVILAHGRASLPLVDELLRVDVPGDPLAEACHAIAFTAEPIAFPPPPTNDDLGLPDVVNDLLVESHVSSADSRTAEALAAADVDADRVRQIEVFLSDIDGGGPTAVIIDGAVAPPDVVAGAIQKQFLPAAEGLGAEQAAGFDVFTYRQSDEPPGSIHVAGRDDRVVVMFDASDAFVRAFLEAIR